MATIHSFHAHGARLFQRVLHIKPTKTLQTPRASRGLGPYRKVRQHDRYPAESSTSPVEFCSTAVCHIQQSRKERREFLPRSESEPANPPAWSGNPCRELFGAVKDKRPVERLA